MTLEDKNRAAAIRAWAAENGFSLKGRGAIPKSVISAYDAAGDQAGDDDDDAADDDGDDGQDWDSEVSDVTGGPRIPDPAAARTEPPVASLEEARERIGSRNRQPKWAKPDGKRQPRREPDPKIRVTASVRADVEAKLTLVLGMIGVPWKAADAYCGGQWAADVESMAKAWAPLLCQSAEVVRFFTRTSTFMLWVAALGSMQNVAGCFYAHHVTRTVQILEDGTIMQQAAAHDHPVPVRQPEPAEDLGLYTVPGHVPEPRTAGGERVWPSS